VLDFGAVDRLPDGLPPIFGKLLWLIHHDGDIAMVEHELREHGFLRPGVTVNLEELHAFLAPLAEPSKGETFSFSREWMRGEASRVADLRSANAARRLNLPPSYVLIHRVSTAGIGVLCQLECSGHFREDVLRWVPGYGPPNGTADSAAPGRQPVPNQTIMLGHDAAASLASATKNGGSKSRGSKANASRSSASKADASSDSANSDGANSDGASKNDPGGSGSGGKAARASRPTSRRPAATSTSGAVGGKVNPDRAAGKKTRGTHDGAAAKNAAAHSGTAAQNGAAAQTSSTNRTSSLDEDPSPV
jgi:hypothetical protein